MEYFNNLRDEKLSWEQKIYNDKEWFKRMTEKYLTSHGSYNSLSGEVDNIRKMQVNYDLYNNKIEVKDFEYVMKPFGIEVGELPVDFQNRDIVSGKINAILGMEKKRVFTWSVVATNPEAITRRESKDKRGDCSTISSNDTR